MSPHGDVDPPDRRPLRWFVAADDRWRDPATESAVRHERLDGSAVFVTRMRIPGGDVVQRIWSVPDDGGLTLVEVANDSSLPIVVAFSRGDLLAARPLQAAPAGVTDVDLPDGSVTLPIGHRTSVTVALSHRGDAGALPASFGTADAVARGWIRRVDAASRFDVPTEVDVEAVRAARCEALLAAPVDAASDPARVLLALLERWRMDDLTDAELDDAVVDVATAVAALPDDDERLRGVAIAAALTLLSAADERRAVEDLRRIPQPAAVSADDLAAALTAPDDVVAVSAFERRLLADGVLFAGGIPDDWRGSNIEAHGLRGGPRTGVSFGLRWHGANAAVLWEQHGEPVTLSSAVPHTSWSTDERRGETLWQLNGGD